MDANWLWILAVLLVLVGLAGTLLPALPGLPFVFGGLLLGAWIDNFQRVGWVTLTILAILTVAAIAIDFFAGMLGAKRVGASKMAMVGAGIGAVAGIFFGLIGIFIGPFIGAFAGEYLERGKLGNAGKVGVATWLGLIFGAILKIGVAFVMLAIFVFAYIMNF
jgi:uncharacterized protein